MNKADLITMISEKAAITRVKAETVVNTLIDGDRDAKKIEHEVRKLVESSREICT